MNNTSQFIRATDHPQWMQSWHAPQRRLLSKVISLLITLTFVLPYLTWAFDATAYPTDPNSVRFHDQLVEIPGELAIVESSFQGDQNLIVHVQDLHCNLEVQTHIAKLIDHLARTQQLNLVTIEGASLPVNVTPLSKFPNAQAKEAVGKYFMKQGKVSGAEFYAGTGKYPVTVDGIEDDKLYSASRAAVMDFLSDESQGFIYDLRETMADQKTVLYNESLKKLDEKKQSYREGAIPVMNFGAYLLGAAKPLGVDLAAYPRLVRYLEKGAGVSAETDELFAELDGLDQAVRDKLYTNQTQRELDGLLSRLDVMEKLLNISATPEEVVAYRQHSERYQVEVFAQFLRSQAAGTEGIGADVYRLNENLAKALRFYDLADIRSGVFVKNTLAKMTHYQTQVAVMVTGGYHTERILADLKARKVSYLSVRPRMEHQDLVNPYFALIRNKRTPIEKLIAEHQNILALAPAFPQTADPGVLSREELARLPQDVRVFVDLLRISLRQAMAVQLLQAGHPGLAELAAQQNAAEAEYPYAGGVTLNWDQAVANNSGQLLVPFNGIAASALIQPKGRSTENLFPLANFETDGAYEVVLLGEPAAAQVRTRLAAAPRVQGLAAGLNFLGVTFATITQSGAVLLNPVPAAVRQAWVGLNGQLSGLQGLLSPTPGSPDPLTASLQQLRERLATGIQWTPATLSYWRFVISVVLPIGLMAAGMIWVLGGGVVLPVSLAAAGVLLLVYRWVQSLPPSLAWGLGAMHGPDGELRLLELLHRTIRETLPRETLATFAKIENETFESILLMRFTGFMLSTQGYTGVEYAEQTRADKRLKQVEGLVETHLATLAKDERLSERRHVLLSAVRSLYQNYHMAIQFFKISDRDFNRYSNNPQEIGELGAFHVGPFLFMQLEKFDQVKDDDQLAAILLHETLEMVGFSHDDTVRWVKELCGYDNETLLMAMGAGVLRRTSRRLIPMLQEAQHNLVRVIIRALLNPGQYHILDLKQRNNMRSDEQPLFHRPERYSRIAGFVRAAYTGFFSTLGFFGLGTILHFTQTQAVWAQLGFVGAALALGFAVYSWFKADQVRRVMQTPQSPGQLIPELTLFPGYAAPDAAAGFAGTLDVVTPDNQVFVAPQVGQLPRYFQYTTWAHVILHQQLGFNEPLAYLFEPIVGLYLMAQRYHEARFVSDRTLWTGILAGSSLVLAAGAGLFILSSMFAVMAGGLFLGIGVLAYFLWAYEQQNIGPPVQKGSHEQQRAALEQKYRFTFPVAAGSYAREFGQSPILLESKLQLLLDNGIKPHPMYFRYSLARLHENLPTLRQLQTSGQRITLAKIAEALKAQPQEAAEVVAAPATLWERLTLLPRILFNSNWPARAAFGLSMLMIAMFAVSCTQTPGLAEISFGAGTYLPIIFSLIGLSILLARIKIPKEQVFPRRLAMITGMILMLVAAGTSLFPGGPILSTQAVDKAAQVSQATQVTEGLTPATTMASGNHLASANTPNYLPGDRLQTAIGATSDVPEQGVQRGANPLQELQTAEVIPGTNAVPATQPATTQPATTQPATTQPATTQPATTQPSVMPGTNAVPASQPADQGTRTNETVRTVPFSAPAALDPATLQGNIEELTDLVRTIDKTQPATTQPTNSLLGQPLTERTNSGFNYTPGQLPSSQLSLRPASAPEDQSLGGQIPQPRSFFGELGSTLYQETTLVGGVQETGFPFGYGMYRLPTGPGLVELKLGGLGTEEGGAVLFSGTFIPRSLTLRNEWRSEDGQTRANFQLNPRLNYTQVGADPSFTGGLQFRSTLERELGWGTLGLSLNSMVAGGYTPDRALQNWVDYTEGLNVDVRGFADIPLSESFALRFSAGYMGIDRGFGNFAPVGRGYERSGWENNAVAGATLFLDRNRLNALEVGVRQPFGQERNDPGVFLQFRTTPEQAFKFLGNTIGLPFKAIFGGHDYSAEAAYQTARRSLWVAAAGVVATLAVLGTSVWATGNISALSLILSGLVDTLFVLFPLGSAWLSYRHGGIIEKLVGDRAIANSEGRLSVRQINALFQLKHSPNRVERQLYQAILIHESYRDHGAGNWAMLPVVGWFYRTFIHAPDNRSGGFTRGWQIEQALMRSEQNRAPQLHRQALEMQFSTLRTPFTFPVEAGTYAREFGQDYTLLLAKTALLVTHRITPHPYLFRYSLARLRAAVPLLRALEAAKRLTIRNIAAALRQAVVPQARLSAAQWMERFSWLPRAFWASPWQARIAATAMVLIAAILMVGCGQVPGITEVSFGARVVLATILALLSLAWLIYSRNAFRGQQIPRRIATTAGFALFLLALAIGLWPGGQTRSLDMAMRANELITTNAENYQVTPSDQAVNIPVAPAQTNQTLIATNQPGLEAGVTNQPATNAVSEVPQVVPVVPVVTNVVRVPVTPETPTNPVPVVPPARFADQVQEMLDLARTNQFAPPTNTLAQPALPILPGLRDFGRPETPPQITQPNFFSQLAQDMSVRVSREENELMLFQVKYETPQWRVQLGTLQGRSIIGEEVSDVTAGIRYLPRALTLYQEYHFGTTVNDVGESLELWTFKGTLGPRFYTGMVGDSPFLTGGLVGRASLNYRLPNAPLTFGLALDGSVSPVGYVPDHVLNTMVNFESGANAYGRLTMDWEMARNWTLSLYGGGKINNADWGMNYGRGTIQEQGALRELWLNDQLWRYEPVYDTTSRTRDAYPFVGSAIGGVVLKAPWFDINFNVSYPLEQQRGQNDLYFSTGIQMPIESLEVPAKVIAAPFIWIGEGIGTGVKSIFGGKKHNYEAQAAYETALKNMLRFFASLFVILGVYFTSVMSRGQFDAMSLAYAGIAVVLFTLFPMVNMLLSYRHGTILEHLIGQEAIATSEGEITPEQAQALYQLRSSPRAIERQLYQAIKVHESFKDHKAGNHAMAPLTGWLYRTLIHRPDNTARAQEIEQAVQAWGEKHARSALVSPGFVVGLRPMNGYFVGGFLGLFAAAGAGLTALFVNQGHSPLTMALALMIGALVVTYLCYVAKSYMDTGIAVQAALFKAYIQKEPTNHRRQLWWTAFYDAIGWNNGLIQNEEAYRFLQKDSPRQAARVFFQAQYLNRFVGLFMLWPGVQTYLESRLIANFNRHPQPLRVTPQLQPYIWGRSGNGSFIIRFLNLVLTKAQASVQIAELWLGAHAKNPGIVRLGQLPMALDRFADQVKATLLGSDRTVIGQLFKILDADEELSIQLHRRTRPDSKNECWMIPIDRESLQVAGKDQVIATLYIGFRSPDEVVDADLPGFKAGWEQATNQKSYVAERYRTALERGRTDKEGKEVRAFHNYVEVRWEKGQVELYINGSKQSEQVKQTLGLAQDRLIVNIPGGTVHALGSGTVYEVQETSDVTYRVYDHGRDLASRPLHLEEAMQNADFTPRRALDFMVVPKKLDAATTNIIRTLRYSMDDVVLSVPIPINLQGTVSQAVEVGDSYQFLIVTAGTGTLTWKNGKGQERTLDLTRGDMLIVPAKLGNYRLTTQGGLRLIKAYESTPEQIAAMQRNSFWDGKDFFKIEPATDRTSAKESSGQGFQTARNWGIALTVIGFVAYLLTRYRDLHLVLGPAGWMVLAPIALLATVYFVYKRLWVERAFDMSAQLQGQGRGLVLALASTYPTFKPEGKDLESGLLDLVTPEGQITIAEQVKYLPKYLQYTTLAHVLIHQKAFVLPEAMVYALEPLIGLGLMVQYEWPRAGKYILGLGTALFLVGSGLAVFTASVVPGLVVLAVSLTVLVGSAWLVGQLQKIAFRKPVQSRLDHGQFSDDWVDPTFLSRRIRTQTPEKVRQELDRIAREQANASSFADLNMTAKLAAVAIWSIRQYAQLGVANQMLAGEFGRFAQNVLRTAGQSAETDPRIDRTNLKLMNLGLRMMMEWNVQGLVLWDQLRAHSPAAGGQGLLYYGQIAEMVQRKFGSYGYTPIPEIVQLEAGIGLPFSDLDEMTLAQKRALEDYWEGRIQALDDAGLKLPIPATQLSLGATKGPKDQISTHLLELGEQALVPDGFGSLEYWIKLYAGLRTGSGGVPLVLLAQRYLQPVLAIANDPLGRAMIAANPRVNLTDLGARFPQLATQGEFVPELYLPQVVQVLQLNAQARTAQPVHAFRPVLGYGSGVLSTIGSVAVGLATVWQGSALFAAAGPVAPVVMLALTALGFVATAWLAAGAVRFAAMGWSVQNALYQASLAPGEEPLPRFQRIASASFWRFAGEAIALSNGWRDTAAMDKLPFTVRQQVEYHEGFLNDLSGMLVLLPGVRTLRSVLGLEAPAAVVAAVTTGVGSADVTAGVLPQGVNEPFLGHRPFGMRLLARMGEGLLFATDLSLGLVEGVRGGLQVIGLVGMWVVQWGLVLFGQGNPTRLEFTPVEQARLEGLKRRLFLPDAFQAKDLDVQRIEFRSLDRRGSLWSRFLNGELAGAFQQTDLQNTTKEERERTVAEIFVPGGLLQAMAEGMPAADGTLGTRIAQTGWRLKGLLFSAIVGRQSRNYFSASRSDGFKDALGLVSIAPDQSLPLEDQDGLTALSTGDPTTSEWLSRPGVNLGISATELVGLLGRYLAEANELLGAPDNSLAEIQAQLTQQLDEGAAPTLATVRHVLENYQGRGSVGTLLRGLAAEVGASTGLSADLAGALGSGLVAESVLQFGRAVRPGAGSRGLTTGGDLRTQVSGMGLGRTTAQIQLAQIRAALTLLAARPDAVGLVQRLRMAESVLISLQGAALGAMVTLEPQMGQALRAELLQMAREQEGSGTRIVRLGADLTGENHGVSLGQVQSLDLDGIEVASPVIYEVVAPPKTELKAADLQGNLGQGVVARRYQGQREVLVPVRHVGTVGWMWRISARLLPMVGVHQMAMRTDPSGYKAMITNGLGQSRLTELLRRDDSAVSRAYYRYAENPQNRRNERELVRTMLRALKAQATGSQEAFERSLVVFSEISRNMRVLSGMPMGSWDKVAAPVEGVFIPAVLMMRGGKGAQGAYMDLLGNRVVRDENQMEQIRRKLFRSSASAA